MTLKSRVRPDAAAPTLCRAVQRANQPKVVGNMLLRSLVTPLLRRLGALDEGNAAGAGGELPQAGGVSVRVRSLLADGMLAPPPEVRPCEL